MNFFFRDLDTFGVYFMKTEGKTTMANLVYKDWHFCAQFY